MRPEILYKLFSSHQSLNGVGPEIARKLENLAGSRVLSLLWHLPNSTLHRRSLSSLKEAIAGETVTLVVKVEEHFRPKSRRLPYRVHCSNDDKTLELIFFHGNETYLQRVLPIGKSCVVSGKIERYHVHWQMTHPDHIGSPASQLEWVGYEPVYPLTHGISQKQLRKFIAEALKRVPNLPEWLNAKLLANKQWPRWQEAVLRIHNPKNNNDVSPRAFWRERLAFDELLANQLSLQLIKQTQVVAKGQAIIGSGKLREKVLAALPFHLTDDQNEALRQIDHDMQSSKRMVRLLQGDVGSGKTIVAFLALLSSIEAGFQGAYLAPTEILARQHAASLAAWADVAGISFSVLSSRDKKTERDQILKKLKSGELNLLIGTHAIIQEDVLFKNLGLAVIDEQHRFGVSQRLQLSEKGYAVDTLVMTATPIPRTLMLATHGDLECSYLRNKPTGRKEIATRAIPMERLNEVFEGVKREVERGGKVYWVCPLVEDSETLDLTSAEDRFQSLNSVFKGQVGLVHGRMKGPEKDAVMDSFVNGQIKILVATTVIEVGVHVEDATVMIVEHADRFGLAQLHQLRGRIGRGSHQASCLLLYQAPLNGIAQARLQIMRQSNDGFQIAEEDLRLRGGGEILGLRQSGLPEFTIVDFEFHQSLLSLAHQEAKAILAKDPFLISERGAALRLLLALFNREEVVRYLNAG